MSRVKSAAKVYFDSLTATQKRKLKANYKYINSKVFEVTGYSPEQIEDFKKEILKLSIDYKG